MSDKKHEAVRVAIETIRASLHTLTAEHRHEVFEELNLILAKELTAQDREVEALKAKVAEWQAHNDQRIQEVYEARDLLGASPNDTLPMVVQRVLEMLYKLVQVASTRTGWAQHTWKFIEDCDAAAKRRHV